jgi:hypothetical protein
MGLLYLCPLNSRLLGLQSQSGDFENGKNLLPVAGLEPYIVQLLAVVNTKC